MMFSFDILKGVKVFGFLIDLTSALKNNKKEAMHLPCNQLPEPDVRIGSKLLKCLPRAQVVGTRPE